MAGELIDASKAGNPPAVRAGKANPKAAAQARAIAHKPGREKLVTIIMERE